MEAQNLRNHLKRYTCVLAAVFVVATARVSADDRFPPAWRGDAGSSYQHWHFPAGNPDGPNPDDANNQFGVSLLTVQGEATGGATWLAVHPAPPPNGSSGVWLIGSGAGGFQ